MTPGKIAVGLAPDWADAIVKNWEGALLDELYSGQKVGLAAALRKAKADGIMVAHDEVEEMVEFGRLDAIEIRNRLKNLWREESRKIEKGEP